MFSFIVKLAADQILQRYRMKKSERVYVQNRKPKHRKINALRTALLVVAILLTATILIILFDKLGGEPGLSSEISLSPSSIGSSSSESLITESLISDSDISRPSRDAVFSQLKEDLQVFADSFNGRIGISYINLTNGEKFSVHEQLPFVAASSIKMSIVTQLYNSIAAGDLTLTQTLKYDSRPYPEGDYEAGSGIIANEPNGTEFSVGRTAQLAVTISDNCATNMIIRALGGIDSIVPHLNEISANVPYREEVKYSNYKGILQKGRHRTCSSDLAAYAAHLYELWKSDEEAYGVLMNDLQNTIFDFGLQSLLPDDVKVAHKIGTNNAYRAENDVGIIFADEPYVLCVMTETENQSDGRSALAQVSLMFYEYITSLYD